MTKQELLESVIGKVKLDPEDLQLLELHLDAVIKFKDLVCNSDHPIDPEEEMDWTDLSFGFFVGHGVLRTSEQDPERVENKYDDAYKLATLVRYTFHYWTH